MTKYLEESDLKERGVYEIHSRNLTWAVWDGKDFVGLRYKFGEARLDRELLGHTVRGAIRYICDLPENIEFREGWFGNSRYYSNEYLLIFLKEIERRNF